ncbi:hypothetical protein SBADM41S_04532 [Streptomyces badius]
MLRWALGADGSPGAFLDAQGERDHVFPASHDFDWTVAGREAHRTGRHPHIAIGKGGGLFVDMLGGTLTVKVTDDTESPDGIYEEPVDEPLQSLADADVEYAEVGPLTLLRVRPYKETDWRYLVFNSLLGSVQRLDSIGPACHRLPEDQGIIFPGGYYLTTGTAKTFDTAEELTEPVFEGAVRSPNGEDVLYVFRSRDGLRSLLLPYNLIRQEVATPLTGRGHALLDDGTLVLLRDNPGRARPACTRCSAGRRRTSPTPTPPPGRRDRAARPDRQRRPGPRDLGLPRARARRSGHDADRRRVRAARLRLRPRPGPLPLAVRPGTGRAR